MKDASRGVHFHYVEGGIYDRGGQRNNRREAEEVAQLALEHVQQNPHQSLGIIAFSKAQADAIEEQLDLLARNNPHLEEFCQDDSPDFFLKPLERVQGDGVTYNRYPTVRDRDRLRQLVVEKLGWRIHRIWSREWFRDRNTQIEPLVERLENLRLQK
ncbi:MAG: hypothetical protein F6K58_15020 [Symploca sp. SIO2E9]|nr:hypothetical protein [Symploca sp. SIO2E9]